MSAALNGTTIALSLISGLFFIIGCVGYADQRDAVQNTAWITSSKDGLDVYFGLRRAYVSFDFFGSTYDGNVQYGSSTDCMDDWCDKCQSDGQGALGLTIIALIFTTVTMALGGALVASANKSMQIANVIMAFFAALTSLIAIGLFMSDCYNAINNDSSDDDTYDDDTDDGSSLSLKWGPGAILTIVGMLLMWIVVVLQIVAAATSA
jgi:hypothetical protein